MLRHLKVVGVADATTLAVALRRSLNAVRHLLRELRELDLVEAQPTRHGVGAPIHQYRLTAAGEALFPSRYERAVAGMLDELIALRGREAAADVVLRHCAPLATELATPSADPEIRGPAIAAALKREGFMAAWVATPDGGVLTEHNCPHRVLAERFPEVCAAEQELLSKAFGARVERRGRIADGCSECSYHVTWNTPSPEESS